LKDIHRVVGRPATDAVKPAQQRFRPAARQLLVEHAKALIVV
jgi:hypothetical protein